MNREIRNVAIIAHVDHGKTTLVDQLLHQSGMFREGELQKLAGGQHGLIMDSNALERERGITILSKNCQVRYQALDGQSYAINIIDTPGHADFGGEVERVLSMADGVLLLVDAFEGPMPQTRFVLSKALGHGLRPVVVVNKADRPDARPDEVVNEVFDLLVELNANDEALDFPVIFASGKDGWATLDLAEPATNLRAVFEAIVRHVPAPQDDAEGTPQLQIATLEYSEYVGRIGIGRVFSGKFTEGQNVTVMHRNGGQTRQRVLQFFQFEALGRKKVDMVSAGDICAVVGLDPIDIGDTVSCPDNPIARPAIAVDEPTITMTFRVNDSPFAGREGEYVTSRQIRDRLERELQSNVALRVDSTAGDEFVVSGRGLMHLGILLEEMRREGYELAAGKPKVILKEINGVRHEPVERLEIDCPSDAQSAVMALLGDRRAEMLKMDAKSGASDYVHMAFRVPARGLIGLRSRMLTATQGRAVMHHTFDCYEPMKGAIPQRAQGVMMASEPGQVTAYALDQLFDRGFFFCPVGEAVYEGMIVGEHNRDNDIVVNVVRGKQLTNFRAATKEDASRVKPPRILSLEASLEYIQDDELVELTPKSIRMRKRSLKESDRKREERRKKS